MCKEATPEHTRARANMRLMNYQPMAKGYMKQLNSPANGPCSRMMPARGQVCTWQVTILHKCDSPDKA